MALPNTPEARAEAIKILREAIMGDGLRFPTVVFGEHRRRRDERGDVHFDPAEPGTDKTVERVFRED